MKAILFYYRQQKTYEVYSHDVDDLLADVLVPGLIAQGKEAFAIQQTGLHDGSALECDRCRRIAIAFMAVQGSSGKAITSEREAADPSAYFASVSGIGEMSARVEAPSRERREKPKRAERPPKVKKEEQRKAEPPPQVKKEKISRPPQPKPVPPSPVRNKPRSNGLPSGIMGVLPTPTNIQRWFGKSQPGGKSKGHATSLMDRIESSPTAEYKDAWEGIQEEEQASSINLKILKLFPILAVVVLAVIGIIFLFKKPSTTPAGSVITKPSVTYTQALETAVAILPSSTHTSIPTPTSNPTITPIPPPTSTPLVLVILTPPTPTPTIPLPPSSTPTEESGCVQALKVTLDDVGKIMCVTGTILKVDQRENGLLILFGVEKGTFYFISYDIAWPIAKPGACVMATGKVQRLSSSPVIVLDIGVPLMLCAQ